MQNIKNPSQRLKEVNDELYVLATKRYKGKDEYNRMNELLKEQDKLLQEQRNGGVKQC